jgi:hypothetical protein
MLQQIAISRVCKFKKRNTVFGKNYRENYLLCTTNTFIS